MSDVEQKAPSATERLVKVATHQAKNLELLRSDGQQLCTSAAAIDGQTLAAVEQLQRIDRKLWHVTFWIYFWSIVSLGILFSQAIGLSG